LSIPLVELEHLCYTECVITHCFIMPHTSFLGSAKADLVLFEVAVLTAAGHSGSPSHASRLLPWVGEGRPCALQSCGFNRCWSFRQSISYLRLFRRVSPPQNIFPLTQARSTCLHPTSMKGPPMLLLFPQPVIYNILSPRVLLSS
jgi:hypothetical protein